MRLRLWLSLGGRPCVTRRARMFRNRVHGRHRRQGDREWSGAVDDRAGLIAENQARRKMGPHERHHRRAGDQHAAAEAHLDLAVREGRREGGAEPVGIGRDDRQTRLHDLGRHSAKAPVGPPRREMHLEIHSAKSALTLTGDAHIARERVAIRVDLERKRARQSLHVHRPAEFNAQVDPPIVERRPDAAQAQDRALVVDGAPAPDGRKAGPVFEPAVDGDRPCLDAARRRVDDRRRLTRRGAAHLRIVRQGRQHPLPARGHGQHGGKGHQARQATTRGRSCPVHGHSVGRPSADGKSHPYFS